MEVGRVVAVDRVVVGRDVVVVGSLVLVDVVSGSVGESGSSAVAPSKVRTASTMAALVRIAQAATTSQNDLACQPSTRPLDAGSSSSIGVPQGRTPGWYSPGPLVPVQSRRGAMRPISTVSELISLSTVVGPSGRAWLPVQAIKKVQVAGRTLSLSGLQPVELCRSLWRQRTQSRELREAIIQVT